MYALAAPVYLVKALITAWQLMRFRRVSTRGALTCPHCRAENLIDILATCPKCRTTEFGNRLRCTACGLKSTAFACDTCGVTIQVL
jgi:predicted RNA-binding Zn-ribbon protein involved in translation (DUF1610 family)